MRKKFAPYLRVFRLPGIIARGDAVFSFLLRLAAFTACLHLAANPAYGKPPYYAFKQFSATTRVNAITAAAILNASSAGLVFSIPWSAVQPGCNNFTFSTAPEDALGYLANNLRADQMIWPGIGGGGDAPACLARSGIPTVTILYAFENKTHDPCKQHTMPLMSDPAYGTLYVAAIHAMLVELAKIPVASGGTLADRVAGINLGAYEAITTELQIPARGCADGSVHQSAEYQTHAWVAAGYKGSQAIGTYAAILQGVLTDSALPAGAAVLQNTTGVETWSFPQPHNAREVLAPILAAATKTWGSRFVISWDEVSGTGQLPRPTIIAAAQNGTPVALEFNSTAIGYTTSCRGIKANGGLDRITATPACFHAMQPRNEAAIPTPLVLWQVEPADFGVHGFFP